MSDKICIVGIAGGTASGKTTIVRKIKDIVMVGFIIKIIINIIMNIGMITMLL